MTAHHIKRLQVQFTGKSQIWRLVTTCTIDTVIVVRLEHSFAQLMEFYIGQKSIHFLPTYAGYSAATHIRMYPLIMF